MRSSDLDGVTYIRIVSVEREVRELEAERFRELWERDDDRDGLQAPYRSIPIKVWALLNRGPLTAPEIAEELGCRRGAVQLAIWKLRGVGQNIRTLRKTHNGHQGRCTYQLLPGPALKITQGPRGMRLGRLKGGCLPDEIEMELR